MHAIGQDDSLLLETDMTRARLRRYFRHGFFPQLIAFEACARHGSVTRAADELSLAQPSVSCLLRKLADTVGGPVIEVRARRMEPTARGRELLALCDELFDAFDRLDERWARAKLIAPLATGPAELPLPGAGTPLALNHAGLGPAAERPRASGPELRRIIRRP